MTVLAVIPARYGSTRFPGKPLADLCGKPLVVHVAERARDARSVGDVLVATDDERIRAAVEAHGFRAVMTSPDCPSGSDRIAEAIAAYPDADVIVNVQGDEPLMRAEVIDRAVAALERDPDCAVATAMIRITSEEQFLSPHVVKVICDRSGRALYFSRSPIPHLSRASEQDMLALAPNARVVLGGGPTRRDRTRRPVSSTTGASRFWGFKHFGLYVYRREALLDFVKMPPSPLEQVEKLEQLRFLEAGQTIRVIETSLDSIGVDTPEDLEAARRMMVAAVQGDGL